ncbi:MAG: putative rane protein [Herbinix sp.]|jgi:tight adherence protein B|nr:putative rane protein [Herbinix sp.]
MDYQTYRLTKKDLLIYLLQGELMAVLIGILFYQHIIGILFLSPITYVYIKRKRKQCILDRKWQLNVEFRDGIISLLAALNAGYSIEHAFKEALEDLKLMYDEKSLIMKEFAYLVNQINMNITVEKALNDFAARSGAEDIINFSEVFSTAKRTGGDIIHIIKTTCNNIGDKIEIKREIKTLITAKKFEADIMKLIPLGIVGYLLLSSPEFLEPLYHNIAGVIIMTILLGCYLIAYQMTEKIMEIEI